MASHSLAVDRDEISLRSLQDQWGEARKRADMFSPKASISKGSVSPVATDVGSCEQIKINLEGRKTEQTYLSGDPQRLENQI